MRPCAVLLVWFVAAVGARADDGLKAEVVAKVKAATVFVKVRFGPKAEATGSGFVVKADKEFAWILTNQHVIAAPVGVPAGRPEVTVVYHSGRKAEQSAVAIVVAADPDRDLAVLKVPVQKEQPAPLDLSPTAEIVETATAYTFGFPFGNKLAVTEGNPAVTVGRGSVSSIRTDARDRVAVVQLDADINPGNSGGPVVNGKGQVIGVAVAKVRGSNIGFAIPPGEILELFDGRVGAVTWTVDKGSATEVTARVAVKLIDPFGKVTAARLRIARWTRGDPPTKADADGVWPLLATDLVVEMKVYDRIVERVAEATVTLKAPAGGTGSETYLLQPVIRNATGKDVSVQPGRQPVRFAAVRPPAIEPPVGPRPKPPAVAEPITPITDGEIRDLGDLTLASVHLGQGHGVLPCVVWNKDATAVFTLTDKGILRKYTCPELKPAGELKIAAKCTWLSLSAAGLVVTSTGKQEAWVIDPDTLKPGLKIDVLGAEWVVSAPGTSFAYAADDSRADPRLGVVDLTTGKVVKWYKPTDFNVKRFSGSFRQPALTADGKVLFVQSSSGFVAFAVDGKTVTMPDEIGEGSGYIHSGGTCYLSVSGPERKLVALPTGGGNMRLRGAEERGYTTFVYAWGDLTEPVLKITSGAYPRALGFDPKSGRIYAQSFEKPLIVFNSKGIKLKEYDFDGKQGRQLGGTVQFLVHPLGGRLLALTGSDLWSVQFQDAK